MGNEWGMGSGEWGKGKEEGMGWVEWSGGDGWAVVMTGMSGVGFWTWFWHAWFLDEFSG